MRNFWNRIDVWCAIAVLIVTGAVSAWSFRVVASVQGGGKGTVMELPAGAHRYVLRTKEGVVGAFHTSLQFDADQYAFELHGAMRLKVGATLVEPTVEFTASFNSIGQLGGTRGTVQAPGVWIRFGSTDIDPIKLSLRTAIDGVAPIQYATLVPGPVVLSAAKPGTFNLEYLHFGSLLASYRDASSELPSMASTLSVVEEGSGEPSEITTHFEVNSADAWQRLAPLLVRGRDAS